jgi:hypothetical protein
MSFAAFLRGQTVHASEGVSSRKQHKYEKRTVEMSIDLGQRSAIFLESIYGKERSALMLQNFVRDKGSQPSPAAAPLMGDVLEIEESDSEAAEKRASLPYGFWRRFMEEEMQMEFTQRKKMQMIRALKYYVLRKQAGASSLSAMRGMRDAGSSRQKGGASNSRKAAGLDFALLQFFVDHVQKLMCRADACMLM